MKEIFEAYERKFGVGISVPFGIAGSDFYLFLYEVYKALETGIPVDMQALLGKLFAPTPPPGTVVY